MADDGRARSKQGRFCQSKRSKSVPDRRQSDVIVDHNYVSAHLCPREVGCKDCCSQIDKLLTSRKIDTDSWKSGRRIIEWSVLIDGLSHCQSCLRGPLYLSRHSVKGEMKIGLSGYLYVQCCCCGYVNGFPYGKTHTDCTSSDHDHVDDDKSAPVQHTKGMASFAVNTKLGAAMVDSMGGPQRVNNVLSTLNLPVISNKNLKKMERRAGKMIEEYAEESMKRASFSAYDQEMRDIAEREVSCALEEMSGPLLDDLGVSLLERDNDSEPALDLSTVFNAASDSDEDQVPVSSSAPNESATTSYASEPLLEASLGCTSSQLESKSSETTTELAVDFEGTQLEAKESPKTPPPFANFRFSPMLIPTKTKSTEPNSGQQERSSTRQRKLTFPPRTRKGMTVCADHAWQKKGFDSLTGHTFLMSKSCYGGKVVQTVIKHRTCGKCKWWRRNRPGAKVPKHRCVWNHQGSARSMEADAGLEAIKNLMSLGTPIDTIEGDGDNTLIARIKSNLGLTVNKKLDKNHCVKNRAKAFYEMKNKKTVKISNQVVQHLTKCIKYALAKNKGDPEGMRENLEAIVPHQFGDHDKCQPRFCGFKRRPEVKYVHRSLPYKSSLTDPILRQKLTEEFQPIISKAAVYSDLGSSQACESANRVTSLRAPKHLHYGESESLDFRVKASAACINEGRKYLSETFKQHGLSPGKYTEAYSAKMDKEREKRRLSASQPAKKRRRLQLKEERCTTKGAMEALEGATYQAEVGLDVDADIESIPDAAPKPSYASVTQLKSTTPNYIALDLETTSLIQHGMIPHITQIAAQDFSTGDSFNAYVIPKLPISDEAEKVTGIVWDGTSLFVSGNKVVCLKIREALNLFLEWLKQFPNPVLIAHNGKTFDFKVFCHAIDKNALQEDFLKSAVGFVDSLGVMRSKIPKLPSYKQTFLAQHVCQETYNAHNAQDDVTMLVKIMKSAKVNDDELIKASFSLDYYFLLDKFNLNKSQNVASLHCLVAKGVKIGMAENIAGSGLNLHHLNVVWRRTGEDGLTNVFSAKNVKEKPRVTADKRVLDDIVSKICQHFKDEENK